MIGILHSLPFLSQSQNTQVNAKCPYSPLNKPSQSVIWSCDFCVLKTTIHRLKIVFWHRPAMLELQEIHRHWSKFRINRLPSLSELTCSECTPSPKVIVDTSVVVALSESETETFQATFSLTLGTLVFKVSIIVQVKLKIIYSFFIVHFFDFCLNQLTFL